MNWKFLKNKILEESPFLAKISLGLTEKESYFPAPPFLLAGSAIVINVFNDEKSSPKLAMIFPYSESIACHFAVIASLAAIKKQTEKELPPLAPLNSGEKVLLDGADYIYRGEQIISGEPFMVFEYDGGIQKVPVRERLRVQHSISNRKLTKRDKPPIKSVIDPILGSNLRGNTSLLQTSVILVSSPGKVKGLVANFSLSAGGGICSKLAHAFGWGSLNEDGEIINWGSTGRKEEPLVLVSSNLADVCEYSELNSHKINLVIVDGSSYLKDLFSLESLLNKKIPVLFIFSGKDQDGIRYLKKKDFTFWAWNSEDLQTLGEGDLSDEDSPFFDLTHKITSFAGFEINTVECCNPDLEKAFDLLNELRQQLTEDDYYPTQILDRLFGFFLRVSRFVASTKTITEKSNNEIVSIQSDLLTFRYYLKEEIFDLFTQIIEFLKQGNDYLSNENAKPARLFSEVNRLIATGHEKICVVLSKSEFEIEKEYLRQKFSGNKVVFDRNANFTMKDKYDAVILCGYLRRNQMLRILDEALGTNLIVLNYAHEKQWTTSVKKQFFGAFDNPDYRNNAVFGKYMAVTDSIPGPAARDIMSPAPVMEEFELKLHKFKKQRVLKSINEESDAQKTEARCVVLNQGNFAFLTESYSVPVINELIGGKSRVERIPQKKIKDILPGDLLLFRESSGRNLIREMADIGLRKSGKPELRVLASEWRGALNEIYERNNRSLSKVREELKAHGCDRNEMTIKNWLFGENQIAPGEDSDIQSIAAAAGNGTLLKSYDDIIEAISQVRGAHIQAARQIARLLEKSVKGDLGDLSETNPEIKVPGLGRVFIVCVESIDAEPVEVPWHKTNKLLREKTTENGTNDTATTI